jgi:hypothetical protein
MEFMVLFIIIVFLLNKIFKQNTMTVISDDISQLEKVERLNLINSALVTNQLT